MLLADWIAIALIVLFALLGFIIGFGKGLRFFTGGLMGAIIAIFVCYALGGIIYNIGFVQTILGKLTGALEGKNTFCNILVAIHIEIVVYYIVLFVIVMIVRAIIVKIIASIVEIKNVVLIIVNRTLGMVLFVAVMLLTVFIIFWIISLIGGSTEADFMLKVSGSKLKIDWLFENNPLMIIIKIIRVKIEMPAGA